MTMGRNPKTYDRKWQRLASRFKALHPSCAVPGCPRRSEHVDHIRTVKSAPHLRLAWSNLQALCSFHHNRLTNAYDHGTIAGVCDDDGFPLDPSHPWAKATSAEAIDTVNRPPPKPDAALVAHLKGRAMRSPRR